MTTSTAKIFILAILGIAVALLGFTLLLRQAEPIKPFESLSLLTGLAGFIFSLYQVLQESGAKSTQRNLLLGLVESIDGNIARVYDFSLKQDPGKNVSDLLLGILRQERDHLIGLMRTHHGDNHLTPGRGTSEQQTSAIELIDGQDKVRAALKQITNDATDFIYIVGGRSRDREYLQCLNNRLSRGDLDYLRVVTGDHIRLPLLEHLSALTEIKKKDENFRYRVSYLEEDKYGSFTVTRETVFWTLPSSTDTQLTTGVVIRSPKVASDFRAHVVALRSGERGTKDLAFYECICRERWPEGVRPEIPAKYKQVTPSLFASENTAKSGE